MLIAVALNARADLCDVLSQAGGSVRWNYLDMAFIRVFRHRGRGQDLGVHPEGLLRLRWNRFDFTIVVLSLPTLIVPFTDVPDTGFFIILRLFRLIAYPRAEVRSPHAALDAGIGAGPESIRLRVGRVGFPCHRFFNRDLSLLSRHRAGIFRRSADQSLFHLSRCSPSKAGTKSPMQSRTRTDSTMIVGVTRSLLRPDRLIGRHVWNESSQCRVRRRNDDGQHEAARGEG